MNIPLFFNQLYVNLRRSSSKILCVKFLKGSEIFWKNFLEKFFGKKFRCANSSNLTFAAIYVIIIIENNYLKDTEKKPAIYYIDHGRGINNVRRIVKKYGGSYKENVSENVYQTKISI